MRSQVTVDGDAIAANVARLQHAHGGAIWAVVKADGYGHGAIVVGRAALAAGAIGVAVATAGEARRLRSALPGVRILILSPLAPGDERDLDGLEVTVSTAAGWELVRERDGLTVHVKVETGMGRWGLDPDDALAVGRAIEGGSLRLGGLCSHLATAEDRDTAYAHEQIARFRAVAAAFPPCPRHLANSGGALYLDAARFDQARCGIALYGISPRDEDPGADGLRPVLSWRSEVRTVRTLLAGQSSGYGRRVLADRPTRLALVPVGYGDGYPRRAAGTAEALIGGRRYRVGSVAMDQLALVLDDDTPAQPGDGVTLVGTDSEERVGIEELARCAGTIGYEIACGFRPRDDRELREAIGG